jgi:cytochrome c oxidase subunit 5a
VSFLSTNTSKARYVNQTTFSFFSQIVRNYSSEHQEESFEHFTERFVKFFDNVDDLFELQRGLNNAFGYDLVPSPSVIEAALKAARRVNDYPTAVRIFEGLKVKAGSEALYKQYMDELAPLKAQLGVETKEELGV